MNQITDQDDLDAIDSRQQSARSINEVRSINFSNVKIAPQFGKGGGSKDRNSRKSNDANGDKLTEERERFGANNPRGGSSRGGGSGNSSKGLLSILNPANFSANYSYNEQYRQDIYTDNFRNVEHRGGLNYAWSPKPKKREPFSKIGFLRNSDYLKLIRDVNFYLLPKQVSVSNQMQRMYEVSTVRDNMSVLNPLTDFEPIITPQVVKTWTWNRNYTVKYDLTQALKLDYQGSAQALILENPGLIPSEVEDPDGYNAYREEIQNSLVEGGEVTTYNHQVNGTYKLPLDKFPLTDWLSADTRYQSSFRWDRAPFAQDTSATPSRTAATSPQHAGQLQELLQQGAVLKGDQQQTPSASLRPRGEQREARRFREHHRRGGEGEEGIEHRGARVALCDGSPHREWHVCAQRRHDASGVCAAGVFRRI